MTGPVPPDGQHVDRPGPEGSSGCFFVISCARSGSTSLARILGVARNGTCHVEPMPNLNVETRLALEGRLPDPEAVIAAQVEPRVIDGMRCDGIHGEKSVTYGPFVEILHRRLGARFIFLKRDGRDVVRSLIDWHNGMFGTIYRECGDPGKLSQRAFNAAAGLPIELDTSDFARPRPRPGEPAFEQWERYSRFEMCAYYWAQCNARYRAELQRIPRDAWRELDYTGVTAEQIIEVAGFCGLEGIDGETVRAALEQRINSLADRGADAGVARFPDWTQWDGGLRRSFDSIAGSTMQDLGYVDAPATRWRPREFGRTWLDHGADVAWFEWMYGSRREMHERAIAWIRSFDGTDQEIRSVADFGCGIAVGYADALADRRYAGFDLCPASTEWCRRHRRNPRHRYESVDFIADPIDERFDAVLSSGTIDNSYDIEAYIDAMLQASSRWIMVTCYRGWFPDLSEHRYGWSAKDGCFYNDVSAARVRAHLVRRGCRDIAVEPVRKSAGGSALETMIIARVGRTGT